ncbi:ATP-dependent nuclease, partial [Candidatus Cyrtobacter comes]
KKPKNEERNKYKINYLGSDRTIKSIMPTNGWSLLGKYFYDSNFFKQATKEEFTKKMKEAMDILLKDAKFRDFKQKVNTEFCTQIDKKGIEAKFSLYDEHHFLKSLEFYNDKEVNLANEGSGVQNSFIIACFRALATFKGTDVNPIFIDEPELYLHPHAKKSLYNVLKNLSNNAQIFYITHSSEFLSYESSNEIRRFYKNDSDGTKCKVTSKAGKLTEKQQSTEGNKISFNNAFFADFVFLVEGYTDLLFLQYIIKTKNKGKTIEDLNISIVECTGKDNISRFYEIYDELGIKCFALFDKDGKDDNDIANLSKLEGYGFPNHLEAFLFDNYHKIKENDKIALIEGWIENPEKDQSKIDEIYAKFEKLLPNNSIIIEIP